ncbi:MAG: M20 family metallopeptidase [Cyclobacteriaceae bacterium]
MIEKIKELSDQYWKSCVEIRRYLHKHPELSFQEDQTAQYVESRLQELPFDELKRVDRNGLLATIKGKDPGKNIMLHADMDALPITEANTHDFVSQNKGVMHACGHDAHTSMLMTAGKILCDLKNEWNGTIRLLFQPAEEKIPGGAKLMLDAGLFDQAQPRSMVGQHVFPWLKTGQVGIKPGKFMASSDELFIKFIGKGGHAAMPESCIDPVLIASHFIVAAQQLVSRNASPKIPTVLSFGKIIGEGATNVIPNEVSIEGTLRTLDETWREACLQKIEFLAVNLAKSMGGQCEVEIARGYPFLNNDGDLAQRLRNGIEAYVGTENVVEQDIWMAAEDFAYYSHQVPSCFYMLGVQNQEKGINSGLHTPTFDIDEDALKMGSGLMAYLALEELVN